MSWAMMTACVGCTITGYLYFRYSWCLNPSLPIKFLTFLFCMLLGCLPLLNGYNFEKIFGGFYGLYRHTLYSIFIFCVILFSITLAADMIFGVLCYTTDLLHYLSPKACLSAKYGYIVLAFVCTVLASYGGLKVPTIKEVAIETDKLTAPQKIVVLSDIHLERTVSAKKIRGIVEKANAQNPDAILLVGDIIDDRVEKVAPLMEILKDLKAEQGVYFVTGNHEFYRNYHATTTALQNIGFKFLENESVQLADNLTIGGIPDTSAGHHWSKKPDLIKTFAQNPEKDFRIVMAHTPTDFGKNANFDLEVSGHTHGGQIFPFHILVKMRHSYLAGLYKMSDNKAQIYVSRGAGQWGPQLRFFAPSEIAILNLVSQH